MPGYLVDHLFHERSSDSQIVANLLFKASRAIGNYVNVLRRTKVLGGCVLSGPKGPPHVYLSVEL